MYVFLWFLIHLQNKRYEICEYWDQQKKLHEKPKKGGLLRYA